VRPKPETALSNMLYVCEILRNKQTKLFQEELFMNIEVILEAIYSILTSENTEAAEAA